MLELSERSWHTLDADDAPAAPETRWGMILAVGTLVILGAVGTLVILGGEIDRWRNRRTGRPPG